jgi:threonine synthase
VQIVYYFHAYNQWVTGFGGTFGEAVTFCVPSGNFGNAMAGYYAKQMGLPIHRIIVATNRNDILHRFISNGDFTKHSVEPSLAPAMDITVPSNFERFLFHHSGDNAAWVTSAMAVAKDTPGFTMGATSRVDIRRECPCVRYPLGDVYSYVSVCCQAWTSVIQVFSLVFGTSLCPRVPVTLTLPQ